MTKEKDSLDSEHYFCYCCCCLLDHHMSSFVDHCVHNKRIQLKYHQLMRAVQDLKHVSMHRIIRVHADLPIADANEFGRPGLAEPSP